MTARSKDIPGYAQAILASLNFSSPDSGRLKTLSNTEWAEAFRFCERSHLSLPLYLRSSDDLPPFARSCLAANSKGNEERWERLKRAYSRLAAGLAGEGISFAVLKGFSQYPLFVSDPRHRAQYDIDLLVPPEEVHAAARVAAQIGYQTVQSRGELPIDHLPTMILETGWKWREDYFDPEMPFFLELHFRCWDPKAEHFGSSDVEQRFWSRMVSRNCEDLSFQGLHAVDSVLYAALHILRHLLHGNGKVGHVYELAYFLEHHAEDNRFWREWSQMCDRELAAPQAICFSLAERWFSCRLHGDASAAIRSLPDGIKHWLDRYAHSPIAGTFRPNKDELWLHWSLVESRRKRLLIAKRKLVPSRLPGTTDAFSGTRKRSKWWGRLRSCCEYLLFVCKRLSHHIRAFPPTAFSALQWFGASWASRSLRKRS